MDTSFPFTYPPTHPAETVQAAVVWDTEYTAQDEGTKDRNWEGEETELIWLNACLLIRGKPWQNAPRLNLFTRPVVAPVLSPFIMKLTGIRQEDVDAGPPLDELLAEFHAFLHGTLAHSNGGDEDILIESARLQGIPCPFGPENCRDMRPVLHAAIEDFLTRKNRPLPENWSDYPSGLVHVPLELDMGPDHHVHDARCDVNALAASIQFLEGHGYEILEYREIPASHVLPAEAAE